MAICSFRADNYDLEGPLPGGELGRILVLLEKAGPGLAHCEAGGEEEILLLRACARAGLVTIRDQAAFLEPAGRKFVDAFRGLLGPEPALQQPPSPRLSDPPL